MFQIIMVCTGNICRSPMAAGLARHLLPAQLKERVLISSAGVYALHGNPAQPYAVDALALMGIDIRDHRASVMTGERARAVDLILTMEKMHYSMVRRLLLWKKSRVHLLTEYGPQPCEPEISDPYGGPLADYQACIATMLPCIRGLMDWLLSQAQIAGLAS